jgi:hypothetical protein
LYCYITYPNETKQALSVSFKTIPVAASIIFTVGVGLPLMVKAILNLYGTGPQTENRHATLFQSVGIYCYSFVSLIMASVLCGCIPYQIAHWILISLAGVH